MTNTELQPFNLIYLTVSALNLYEFYIRYGDFYGFDGDQAGSDASPVVTTSRKLNPVKSIE